MAVSAAYVSVLQAAFKPLELDLTKHRSFFESWEQFSFKRAQLITQIGKPEPYFYVVLHGVQAIYLLDEHGEKRVLGFSFDGSYSGVYDAFLNRSPALYAVEALTPSTLIRTTKKHYDQWFEEFPEFNYWGRIVHQQLLIGRVNREVELITLSAKQRFDEFNKRCPRPLLTIPQKYLASYLNMTPETYSRLRGQKS